MIFITVGTQLGFDRLIKVMDIWAGSHSDAHIFAQIGEGVYQPHNFDYSRKLSTAEFMAQAKKSSLLVSHGGMGTILTAMELEKPLILVPRYSKMGEHRNDHQVATCDKFKNHKGIRVAWKTDQLIDLMNSEGTLTAATTDGLASRNFSAALKNKIDAILGL